MESAEEDNIPIDICNEISIDEILQDFSERNFSESEQITLCLELPCKVVLGRRNIYWKFERKVIDAIKAKNIEIKEKHYKYVYKKFIKNFKEYYEKQLLNEKSYHENKSEILIRNKVNANLFLLDSDPDSYVYPMNNHEPLDFSFSDSETPNTLTDFLHGVAKIGSEAEVGTEIQEPVGQLLETEEETYSQFQGGVTARLQGSEITSTQDVLFRNDIV